VSEVVAAGLFAAVGVLFAFVAPAAIVPILAVVAAMTVVGVLLRWFLPRYGREAALVGAITATAVVTSLAPATLAAEVLAGFVALVALFWTAGDPGRPSAFAYRASGLTLPALAVAVAIVVSGILPSLQALVGLAVVLVLVVVFWVAYVLNRPEPFRVALEGEGEPS
jgi:hypothetical protein